MAAQPYVFNILEKVDFKTNDIDNIKNRGENINNSLSFMLTSTHRFKMHYLKLALVDSLFENYNELAFFSSLVYKGPMTHSQLIELQVQSKPTGTDIIKRLLKKELIAQKPSEKDKRSKVLTITPSGQEHFNSCIGKISQLTERMMYPLPPKELIAFYEIIAKLYKLHHHIYSNEKTTHLDKIIEKYSSQEQKDTETSKVIKTNIHKI